MTFDNDMVKLCFDYLGERLFTCKQLGLEWPPPETLDLANFVPNCEPGDLLVRVKMSKLTDNEREQMPFIARAAEYRYADSQQMTQNSQHTVTKGD